MSYLIKIIGNSDYVLTSDNKKVLCMNNAITPPEETEDSVFLSLFGRPKKWYKKDWLILVSSYNLRPPRGYEEAIDQFKFIKITAGYKTLDRHIVILKTPIYNHTKSDFRMVARFPDYFISNDGCIYNEETRKLVDIKQNPKSYPRASLRDQSGKLVYSSCSVHRLVALAWIPNDDYNAKPILDHIDGDKTNSSASNLRWVSYVENANLAFEQELKTHNVPLNIKNIKTGEITRVNTLREAAKFMGIAKSSVSVNNIMLDKLWKCDNGEFEVKLVNDISKWKYEDNKDSYSPHCATSVIEITIDEITKSYSNWREVKLDVLKVKPESSYTIPMILDKIKRRYPNSKVVYKEIKGVIADNGKETLEAENMLEMANRLGIPKSAVIHGAATGRLYKGWLFKRRVLERPLN